MRRATLLIALFTALLAFPAGALADGAGHNPPTKKLEAAFSIALTLRVASADGCYPSPSTMIPFIKKYGRVNAGVSSGVRSTPRPGIVYVTRRGTSCNGVRMALRYKRVVYVLDSRRGEIVILGGDDKGADQAVIDNRGPLRALTVATRAFNISEPDVRQRLEVRCPGKSVPLGGGVTSSPGLGTDGEGFYPHSFERLGAQRGWHVSGWVFDPSEGAKASRRVTVQAICGRGLAPMSAPHRTTFVRPGETKTVIARCPRGQYLMSGGYQRTDFLSEGGNYITESRAIGPQAWSVSASAHGAYGGELTAIAYCVRNKGPLLSEVSASTPVGFGQAASVTTPQCAPGRRMTLGGFSANGSSFAYYAGGAVNADNTWSISGYGFFGPAPEMTAYGYCLKPN